LADEYGTYSYPGSTREENGAYKDQKEEHIMIFQVFTLRVPNVTFMSWRAAVELGEPDLLDLYNTA